MRLCFVTPRYGEEIVGGAETHVRDVAERLAGAGHAVSVLTTCVRDHLAWANDYPAGWASVGGVRVRRLPVTAARDHAAVARLQPLVDSGLPLSAEQEMSWVMSTGHSEPLLEAIAQTADGVDLLYFAPYLFASTVLGALVRPERSIVMPCLHDEPYARFGLMRRTLRAVRGLVFNTEAERDLAEDVIGELPPHRVVGSGFDPPGRLDPRGFRLRHRLDGDLVSYAGRRERGKNFPLLVESVTAHSRHLSADGPVTLVVMGSGPYDLPAPARGLVRDLGFVSQREKLDALAASTAVANLSTNESLSYVVLEAWTCSSPVIVHADCPVTRGHCEESGGGLWVRGVEEFSEALDRLRSDPGLARSLGEAGRRYVASRYSWPAALGRLESALADLAA